MARPPPSRPLSASPAPAEDQGLCSGWTRGRAARSPCGSPVPTSMMIFAFISVPGSRPLPGGLAQVAAGPGEPDPRRCIRPRDASTRHHVRAPPLPCWGPWAVGAGCSETPVFAPSRPQDPPSSVTTGVDQGKAPTGLAEVLDRPAVLPGECDAQARSQVPQKVCGHGLAVPAHAPSPLCPAPREQPALCQLLGFSVL